MWITFGVPKESRIEVFYKMKNTIMIKKRYEFKYLFSKGKFFYGTYINMYILENKKKL